MSQEDWEKIPEDELKIVRKHCKHDTVYENKSPEFVKKDESYELRCNQCGVLIAEIPYKKLMEKYLQNDEGEPVCCAMCGCFMKKNEPHEMEGDEPVHGRCVWGDDW